MVKSNARLIGISSSLFAHKDSKLPGIFMLVISLVGIFPTSIFLISAGFYFSTISLFFALMLLFILPFIGIIYASTLNLFANNLQNDSNICTHRKVTIFTSSIVFSFISTLLVINSFTSFIEYDLYYPGNLLLVIVLYIVLVFSGIASIKGSCLWFKNQNKSGFYTLLISSIVGIVAVIAIICLFQNKPFFHVLLLVMLLVTLVENILLHLACRT